MSTIRKEISDLEVGQPFEDSDYNKLGVQFSIIGDHKYIIYNEIDGKELITATDVGNGHGVVTSVEVFNSTDELSQALDNIR